MDFIQRKPSGYLKIHSLLIIVIVHNNNHITWKNVQPRRPWTLTYICWPTDGFRQKEPLTELFGPCSLYRSHCLMTLYILPNQQLCRPHTWPDLQNCRKIATTCPQTALLFSHVNRTESTSSKIKIRRHTMFFILWGLKRQGWGAAI